jgi:hypothetical protein
METATKGNLKKLKSKTEGQSDTRQNSRKESSRFKE